MAEKAYIFAAPGIIDGPGILWTDSEEQAAEQTLAEAADADFDLDRSDIHIERAPEYDDYSGTYRDLDHSVDFALVRRDAKRLHEEEANRLREHRNRLVWALAEATQRGYMTVSGAAEVLTSINGYDGERDITEESGFNDACRAVRESMQSLSK